ncbi:MULTISPECIES: site-specific DNA-methyltransferase [Anaerococcus]|uniref:site-specific DNA-methyltransferase n=1 Tax=Anaerococcus TaxID=165779 RepID=UPI0002E8A22F|nr:MULTISPECIES: site-specific DNA-methyltransferase [Anaerococcus]MDU1315651.1 DNA methyltransferase [Anaerococcus hydrogenalis]
MIGQNLKSNQDKKPNSREMEKLKKEFPQFFTKDGEFKIDNFKDFLKEEEIELSKEGYGLEFLGKSYAKYLSSLESETYISPDLKHNEKDENKNSENLYIVGDNIDALKHLLGSYSGKIKCIYIDPPYNTGSDGFVYPDNFNFNSEELARTIGITEEEAERILNLSGKSTHSAWLTFIYPRLLLARDLLADDGVIFISIDDNEQANLKLICDEIFGEENKVGNLPTIMNLKGNQDEFAFAGTHEYTIVYAKHKENLIIKGLKIDDDEIISDWMIDDIGYYKKGASLISTGQNAPRDHRPKLRFPIFYKNGNLKLPEKHILNSLYDSEKKVFNDSYLEKYIDDKKSEGYLPILPFVNKKKASWRWSYSKLQSQLDEVIITKTKNGISLNKKQRPELSDLPSKKVKTLLYKPEYSSGNGTNEVKNLFGIERLFDNPKPIKLIEDFINISLNNNDIILDFFSGSATTADALMQLNAEDGGKRKYIMVQIPEKIDKKKPAFKSGYKTIDEIGRERIKRAGKKIKNETGANIDYGFKLFYLEKPKEKTLDKLEEFSPQIKFPLDDMVSIFDNDHASGKENILSTWLNEDGYGLSQSSDEYVLDEYRANLIGKSLYIIDSGLGSSDVMELIRRIEDDSLLINRIVVYLHSIDFSVLQELRTNLSVLRNNKNVSLIERF